MTNDEKLGIGRKRPDAFSHRYARRSQDFLQDVYEIEDRSSQAWLRGRAVRLFILGMLVLGFAVWMATYNYSPDVGWTSLLNELVAAAIGTGFFVLSWLNWRAIREDKKDE